MIQHRHGLYTPNTTTRHMPFGGISIASSLVDVHHDDYGICNIYRCSVFFFGMRQRDGRMCEWSPVGQNRNGVRVRQIIFARSSGCCTVHIECNQQVQPSQHNKCAISPVSFVWIFFYLYTLLQFSCGVSRLLLYDVHILVHIFITHAGEL